MDILEKIKNYRTTCYNWKERLQSTEQDSQYHQEGNVWIHTMLVVENLLNCSDYKALNTNEKKVLLFASILHDIAKPFCTKIDNGKIVSPHHAVKGEIEARKLIYRYDFMKELLGSLDFKEREQVCSLVRYHGLPILFLEKMDTHQSVIKAALEIPAKYLYILAKADIKGRVSKSNDRNLQLIELYKDYCLENNCFNNLYSFQSPSSKIMYFKKGDSYLHYVPFEENSSKVYVMSGIPASGKDTYIKNNFFNQNVISLDNIREEMGVDPAKNQGIVVQEARKRAKKLLAAKENFVWNSTNTTEKIRTQLISLFLDYNAYVELVYIETKYKELINRNKERKREVPQNVINKLVDCLQVPKPWEAHFVRYEITN